MTTTAPARVVVADDSAMMRAIVTNSLKLAGVEVVGSAANGDEALALCERVRPDAMTLDLAMPGLDGIGVLRALRLRGDGSVPVVVVSAFSPAHGARAVDALAEGAFDLVAKPAIGEGLDAFKTSLGEKIAAAVQAGRRRGSTSTAHAPGACDAPARRDRGRAHRRRPVTAPAAGEGRHPEGGRDRDLDRRPTGPGFADAQASRAG